MKYYKLTDENMETHNGTKWEIGVEKTTDGVGDLCGSGWLHCYNDPKLAVLLNRIHTDFKNPRLFEIEVGGDMKEDCGLKFGFTKMKLVKEIPLPIITTEQRVEFAIRCGKKVCSNKKWNAWADNWLNGVDRTADAARAAAGAEAAAEAAAAAAAAARAVQAARAAQAAAAAAWAAAAAARAVQAARTAQAAAAAARAVQAAGAASENFNLLDILGEMQWK